MKKILALALIAAAAGSATAQTSVSIGINQPGVYGRINIGDLPRAALVRAEPVIIAPPARAISRRPIYLYVPVQYQSNWARYCGRYNACGQPVYFVQDQWVRDRYSERHPGWDRGRARNVRQEERRVDHREDRREERHDDHHDDHHDDRHDHH